METVQPVDPAAAHAHAAAPRNPQLSTALTAELASLVPTKLGVDGAAVVRSLEKANLGGLSTVLAGLVEWLLGEGGRRGWTLDYHLMNKVVRTHIRFSGPAISRSRERLISYLLPAPLRTSIEPARFFVDVSAIVASEEASRAHIPAGVGRPGYVIPPEMAWGSDAEDRDVRPESLADGKGSWLEGAPGIRYENGPVPAPQKGTAPAPVPRRRPRVHELPGEWVSWYGEEPPFATQKGPVRRRGSLVEWAIEEARRTVWYEAMGTRVEDRGGKRGVVLYLHGGAYALGSPRTHRFITSKISKLTGLPVLAIDYRLAPENPFPAAIHDALAAWLYLTQPNHPAVHMQSGGKGPAPGSYRPEEVVVMGDSAGGNLTLSLCMYLKHFLVGPDGAPKYGLPRGICLLSPSCDQTMRHDSYVRNAPFDYLPSPAIWKEWGSVDIFLNSTDAVGGNYNPVSGLVWGGTPDPARRVSLRVPRDAQPKDIKPPPELVPSSQGGANGHSRKESSSSVSSASTAVSAQQPLPEDQPLKSRRASLIGVPRSQSFPAGVNGGENGGRVGRSGSFSEPRTRRASIVSEAEDSGSESPRRRPSMALPAEPTVEDLVYNAIRHPCVSPYHGSFEGMPPALFQAGECELLVDEIVATAHKYALQNPGASKVRCEIFHDLTHVPHAYPGSRGGAAALRNIGRFVRNLFSDAPHEMEEDPHVLRRLALGKEAGDVEVFYGGFGEADDDEEEVEEPEIEMGEVPLEKLGELAEGRIPEGWESQEDEWERIPGAI
ncbi:Alpha/Beta hydrolase protein [Hyaloraphidium curvatum]|nr:Alpha/Beta hydrolase protein [Hyaloraphidium curvatum]